jgi:TetR/AcrR family transcriptional repressor of nem operon
MLHMRKPTEHKAETRARIVEAASTLFRQHGIDGVGVDAVMHAAGLTHGGFYGHFSSKEALVAEVSAASLARAAARWERISAETPPDAALAEIVKGYLDPVHVAAVERGCVLTTLGAEVARRPEQRPAITASMERMVEVLARLLPGGRDRALAALSGMVGAVVLARLADGPELAAEILSCAKAAVLSTPNR